MLEVSHVNVNYGKSRVITDVSFTLNRGRKLVVLGRNGVGKTTLMKCIMGLLPVEGKGTLKRIAEDFIILQKGSIVAQGAIGELNDDLAKKYLAV